MADPITYWLIAGAKAVLGSGTVGKIAITAIHYVAPVLVSAGISALGASLASAGQSQEANTSSVKQTIPPRRRAYGRCRLGGAFALWEAKGRWGYDVIALQEGRSEAIEKVWIHDHEIEEILEGGYVVGVDGKYSGGGNDLIHVEWRLGLPTETAYPALVAALGGAGVWTNDHRGDGVTSLGLDYQHGDWDRIARQWPGGLQPEWSAVGLWTPVWDGRDEDQEPGDPDDRTVDPISEWGWKSTGNLALQILDHCRRADGMAWDFEKEILPAIDHWMAEADICDELVSLAGGGSEPRYHGSGIHSIPDDPQDALDEMLAACDGKILRDEHGVQRLWVGKVREPTVWLDDADIADYQIDLDAAPYDAVNELVPTYVSEASGWNTSPATRWVDTADAAIRGRHLGAEFPLPRVNSEGQARRLTKRQIKMGLTPIRGNLTGLLSCARAMGHRWVGLSLADADLSEAVIEVQGGGKIAFSSLSVELPFALVPDDIDDWSAEDEEQPGEAPPPPITSDPINTPEIADVSVVETDFGSSVGTKLLVEVEGEWSSDLTWMLRTREPGGYWSAPENPFDTDSGPDVVLESGFVPSVEGLQVQVAYRTGGGRMSDWSVSFLVDATVASPPAVTPPPPEVSASVAGTTATIGWRYPMSPFHHVSILRASVPDLTGPTELTGDHAGALGAMDDHDITGLTPGAWWWGVVAWSDDDTPSVATGPVFGPVLTEPDANLLSNGSAFDNAAWSKVALTTGTAPVVTANAGEAPDGTMTADRIVFSCLGTNVNTDGSYVVQSPAGAAAAQHGSVWLKSNTGTDQTVAIRAGGTYQVVTVKPYWQRFSVTAPSAARTLHIALRGTITGTTASADVLAWGAHLALT